MVVRYGKSDVRVFETWSIWVAQVSALWWIKLCWMGLHFSPKSANPLEEKTTANQATVDCHGHFGPQPNMKTYGDES